MVDGAWQTRHDGLASWAHCPILLVLFIPTSYLRAKPLEQRCHAHTVFYQRAQIGYVHTLLLHGVTVSQRHLAVLWRVVVHGHAERRADGVLAAVTLADGVFGISIVGVDCLLYTSDAADE